MFMCSSDCSWTRSIFSCGRWMHSPRSCNPCISTWIKRVVHQVISPMYRRRAMHRYVWQRSSDHHSYPHRINICTLIEPRRVLIDTPVSTSWIKNVLTPWEPHAEWCGCVRNTSDHQTEPWCFGSRLERIFQTSTLHVTTFGCSPYHPRGESYFICLVIRSSHPTSMG